MTCQYLVSEARLDLVQVLDREVLAKQVDTLLGLLDDYRTGGRTTP